MSSEDFDSDQQRQELIRELLATKRWNEATQAANTIDAPSEKAKALAEIAVREMSFGLGQEADELLESALDIVSSLSKEFQQAESFSAIAVELSQVSQLQAESVFLEALQVACSIDNPHGLRAVAVGRAKCSQFDQAVEIAHQIED